MRACNLLSASVLGFALYKKLREKALNTVVSKAKRKLATELLIAFQKMRALAQIQKLSDKLKNGFKKNLGNRKNHGKNTITKNHRHEKDRVKIGTIWGETEPIVRKDFDNSNNTDSLTFTPQAKLIASNSEIYKKWKQDQNLSMARPQAQNQVAKILVSDMRHFKLIIQKLEKTYRLFKTRNAGCEACQIFSLN